MVDEPSELGAVVPRAPQPAVHPGGWTTRRTIYALGLVALSVAIALLPIPWARWGALGLLGLFLGTCASGLMTFLPSPAYGIIFSAARGYGLLPAAIVGGVGWSIGEMLMFHAGRHMPPAIAAWVERCLPCLMGLLRTPFWGSVLIFFVTLIPNPLFDVVSIFAARLGLRARAYFIPMAMARVTRSAIIAWLAIPH